MNGKFIGGIIFAVIIIGLAAFGMGVFEEASDGPIENAIEKVDDAIKN